MIKGKLLLSILALFCFVQARADVKINATNFPDANFRNYLKSQTYGKDGVITSNEIAAIVQISVNEKNITSLKGIELFTNLTSLACDDNQLTSLDVSKNTALKGLWCSSNQLTSLDFSKNTALELLECNDNQLTSLNVSKNTALETLWCYSNKLTSLDVSKNTTLTSLLCYNNQLTSLDVSKNTALETLWCYSNQITSLDVSKNTALTTLACDDNRLTSLDVSKNTALTTLCCSTNQIRGEEMDALVESLPTVEKGVMNVIYNKDEGNVMTTTQVAAAKAKGWSPKYYDGNNWLEYAGSDPAGIDGVLLDNGGGVKIFSIDGTPLSEPRKGINIIRMENGKTKKVVVK